MRIYTFYRITENINENTKEQHIDKIDDCLASYVEEFHSNGEGFDRLYIIADNVSDKFYQDILKYVPSSCVHRGSYGNAGSAQQLLIEAATSKKIKDGDIVYFTEDDYLYRTGAKNMMLEGFRETDTDYLTLYDHPDKYVNAEDGGGNPFISGGGELTRVLLTTNSHWKISNSTTFTWAARWEIYRSDYDSWMKWSSMRDYTMAFQCFLELDQIKQRKLILPIPGYSTHCLNGYLSPLIDWDHYGWKAPRTITYKDVVERDRKKSDS